MQRKGIVTQFRLGQVVAKPGILDAVPRGELLAALKRHQHCDWGEVPASDWAANDLALTHGGRIISAYESETKTKFGSSQRQTGRQRRFCFRRNTEKWRVFYERESSGGDRPSGWAAAGYGRSKPGSVGYRDASAFAPPGEMLCKILSGKKSMGIQGPGDLWRRSGKSPRTGFCVSILRRARRRQRPFISM